MGGECTVTPSLIYDAKKRYRWTVRVDRFNAEMFMMGLTKESNIWTYPKNLGFMLSDDGFIYQPLNDGSDEASEKRYCRRFAAGDIVSVIIDCEKQSISFEINRMSQGVAFAEIDKDQTYRLVVALDGFDVVRDQCTLIEFASI